jgi:Concanavalin A-like lectin/glucanases superfamily
MPNAACPRCKKPLSILLTEPNSMVQCPSCHSIFGTNEAVQKGASNSTTEGAFAATPVAAPARTVDAPKISRHIALPIPLKFRVANDPQNVWSGEIDADLASDGLELIKIADGEDAVVPFDSEVRHGGGADIAVHCDGVTVTLTLITPGVDQVRMARELAAFLRGNRSRFDSGDYRLPRTLFILATLPLALPVVAGVAMFILAEHPPTDIRPIIYWCLPSVALALVLYWYARSGMPSVKSRVQIGLLLTTLVTVIPGAYLAWRYVDPFLFFPGPPLIDDKQWVEFVCPQKEFRVDFPGQATVKEGPMPGIRPRVGKIQAVELGHSAYLVSYYDFGPLDAIPDGDRVFEEVRDTFLQRIPGTTVSKEHDINFAGFLCREITLAEPKRGNRIARVFLTEGRIYTLAVGGRHYDSDSPNVKRFFESFHLTQLPIPPAKDFKGLIGYWSFDDGDDDHVPDLSANGNHALNRGAKRTYGIRGKALKFDGKSHVELPAVPQLNFGKHDPFTIAGWFRASGAMPSQTMNSSIVSFHNEGSPARAVEIAVDFGDLLANAGTEEPVRQNWNDALRSERNCADNRWHHFAVSCQPEGSLTLYRDGIKADSKPRQVDKLVAPSLKLGQGFTGMLDEISVFNRVLADNEIAELAGKNLVE